MPRLFSDTHHIHTLRQRLHHRLQNPMAGEAAQAQSLPQPTATTPTQGRGSWVRHRLEAWRREGYHPRWLLLRIPGLRSLYTLQRGLRRLRPLLLEMRHTQVMHGEALQRLEQQRRQERMAHQEQAERQRLELAFLQHELAQWRQSAASPAQAADQPAPAEQADSQLQSWYLDFEQHHRGQAAEIRERQRAYLPYVHQAIPDPLDGTVVDLGCGRGEWLQLLREEGFQTLGVDSNAAMAQVAREQGLTVHETDLLTYLDLAGEESAAVVSAFHVVEHLPLEALMRLLRQSFRALRPGGLIILETPNPENLQVGAYSFWMDPTHCKPLPPPLLLHMAGYVGFIDLHIHRLNPWPQHQPVSQGDEGTIEQLNRLIYGEQDYALIARKPLRDPDA